MRGLGHQQGRIILLGDGTEVLTDSDDTEMFDHDEEDKDLESQVSKANPNTEQARTEREGTPGPDSKHSTEKPDPELLTASKSIQNADANHHQVNSEEAKPDTKTN